MGFGDRAAGGEAEIQRCFGFVKNLICSFTKPSEHWAQKGEEKVQFDLRCRKVSPPGISLASHTQLREYELHLAGLAGLLSEFIPRRVLSMPLTASMPSGSKGQLWTADEFLDWLEPGIKAELIRGQTFMLSPVSLKHARLLNFLERLLGCFVESRSLGEVHREFVAVRLSAREVYLPDIAFFTTEQVARLQPACAPFAPELVIEALSPSSEERDTQWKFAAYEEHGVKEYWIVDPDHLRHRFFRREGELLVEFSAADETIHSQAIEGVWVKRSWLDPEAKPNVTRCLHELGTI